MCAPFCLTKPFPGDEPSREAATETQNGKTMSLCVSHINVNSKGSTSSSVTVHITKYVYAFLVACFIDFFYHTSCSIPFRSFRIFRLGWHSFCSSRKILLSLQLNISIVAAANECWQWKWFFLLHLSTFSLFLLLLILISRSALSLLGGLRYFRKWNFDVSWVFYIQNSLRMEMAPLLPREWKKFSPSSHQILFAKMKFAVKK